MVAVEAIPVALPLRRSVGFASGTITIADNVLVRVYSDAGLVGCAEAQPRPYTYGETQGSILRAVRDWFAPRLEGVDPVAHERARAVCAGLSGNRCARAAVEVALADLAGQLVGVSCGRMLGGASDSLPVACMISFGTPEEMAQDAVALHERLGITTFKVKVGRDVALDVASVRAVREAVRDATLYVDANRGWTLAQAREAQPALLELGVQAIEEPLDLADAAGRQQLSEASPIPIGGDESCLSLTDVAREVAGPVSQVSIKIARTAFVESAAILAYCRATATRAIIGSQYEGALGAWASIAFAASDAELATTPIEAANFLDLAGDLVTPPEIVDGRVTVPDQPGLGVLVDPGALSRYRSDG
ncbi:MAG: hypothetical protein JO130_09625 [Solirubrobacterales bacterium]|nr:hypothetical protein [Solirubrobacterales bacterium]